MTSVCPRRISTVDDVLAVLVSGRASFVEWMDCLDVVRTVGRNDLVEECALQALRAVDVKRIGPDSLKRAARDLVGAYLASANVLRQLSDAIVRATEQLDQLIPTIKFQGARTVLASERSRLAALPLLLDEGSGASLTKACSLLRKLHRPDLGREAATRHLLTDPNDPAALTTRGAAAADERDYNTSLGDLRRAWKLRRDSRTGTALARTLIATQHFTEAITVAEEAADLEPSEITFKVLAASAWAGSDEGARRRASLLLQGFSNGQDEPSDATGMRWPAVLAAKQLMRDGELELARKALVEVLRSGSYAPAEKVLRQVEARLRLGQRQLP